MHQLIEGRSTIPILVSGAVATNDAANYVFAGADIVETGDFASSTGWVLGTGWTISGGNATHTAGVDTLSQIGHVIPGCEHILSYTLTNVTTGSVTASLGGGTNGTAQTANGTFHEFITAGNARDLVFTPTTGFDGDIDDVVLRTVGPDVLLCTVANDGASTDPNFAILVNPDFPLGVPTEASTTVFEHMVRPGLAEDMCWHQTRLIRNISVFVNGTLGAAQNQLVRGLAPFAKR